MSPNPLHEARLDSEQWRATCADAQSGPPIGLPCRAWWPGPAVQGVVPAATTADGRDRKQLERICRFAHDAVMGLARSSRQALVDLFMSDVAADLMLDPSSVAPAGTRWAVIVDVTASLGFERLHLDVKQSNLPPERLLALRDVLVRHAGRLTNGFAPVPVERITITADKSRITVESYDATESFRSAGCIEVQLIDPQGIELACATDKSTCTLEWTHKKDQRLDLYIWDPTHADERIQKGHHHRLRSRARASLISSCAKNSALMWASVSSDLSVTPTTTLMSGKKTR